MSRRLHAALAVATLVGTLAMPGLARAEGQPVISLEMIQPFRSIPVWVYSDRASPVVTLPVRRVTGSGENIDIEYDMTATPQMVTNCPSPRIVGSGENASVECDETAAKAASHAMPNVQGSHNPGLWNLMRLPPSLR